MELKEILTQQRVKMGLPATCAGYIVWRIKNFGPINTAHFEEVLGLTREEVKHIVSVLNKKQPDIDIVASTPVKHLEVIGLVSRHKGKYELQADYTAFVRSLQTRAPKEKTKQVRKTKEITYLEALWNMHGYGAFVSHKDYYSGLQVPFRSFYRYLSALLASGYIFKRRSKVDGKQVTEYTITEAGKEFLESKMQALGIELKPFPR